MGKLFAEDLEHVTTHTRGLWEDLRGKRIFITGGTGFFGCWLLETFAWANDKLNLGASACVLTRDPDAFRLKAPHLAAHPAVSLHAGDIGSFAFPAGEYPFIIHAATETHYALDEAQPLAVFDSNLHGTRRVLDFAVHCGAQRLLYTSSGAVYGRQPPELTHVPEDYAGAPDTTDSRAGYGESKRVGEFMCAMYANRHGLGAAIARCFAFVGPHLPMDANFAIGNFIRDAMRGGPIRVNDGTPYRSYLYASDLAIWLWTILFRGKPAYPYNVGTEQELTIADLARKVAEVVRPDVEIRTAGRAVPGSLPARYVPSTKRAAELGLRPFITLEEGIERTVRWHGRRIAAKG